MSRYLFCVLIVSGSVSRSPAQLLPASADILDAFPYPLVEARGIVVVPNGPPVLGCRAGLLFVKNDDSWSEPTPILLSGGIPPDGSDIVLVIRARRSLERITAGDGRVDPDVTGYSGRKFANISVDGFYMYSGQPLPKSPKVVEEMKARLARLSAPPAQTEAKPFGLALLAAPENREVVLGGVAALATFLAAFRSRKS